MFGRPCLPALLVAVFCGAFGVHAEGQRFAHDYDTPEYTLKSSGVLRRMIQLDKDVGVERLLCKDNVILVAMENMTYAETWEVGDLVVGGAEWGCVMTDGVHGDTVDNHREHGFHRLVEEVHIKSEKRVDIYTKPAGLFDLFLEADIFYQHRQPPEAASNGHSRRRKRSIVPWRATSEDLPLEYTFHTAEAFPGAGNVQYGLMDESINTTLSFYEIRLLLETVNWHENEKQIIPVNYDEGRDCSLGAYGFKNGQFVANSSFFDPREESGAKTSTDSAQWEVICRDCYVYYYPEVEFELQIDQLIGVKKYALRLDGEFESNIDAVASASEELSVILKNEIFYESLDHLWISIPLVKEIDMYLTPKFNITMDAFIDLKTSGPGHVNVGFHEIGNLSIAREWTRDGHFQNYSYVSGFEDRPHQLNVDVEGEVFYNMSLLNTLIDIKADIFWKMPKNIFGFYLTSPMQIRVEPNVIGSTLVNEHDVACVNSDASVTASVYVEDIKYNVELLGQKYDFLILPTVEDNTFMMMENTPILEGNDMCEIQCFGANEVGGADMEETCGPPTEKITRQSDAFDNLVQLLGGVMLFSPEGEGADWCGTSGRACLECTHGVVGHTDQLKCATRMVTKTLAVNLDRLAEWIRQEWTTEGRKLYVLEAWSENTSSAPDGDHGDASLYYEGRAARLAITAAFPNGSADVGTDRTLLRRLGQLATCSGLPFVKMFADYVEVAVEVDTVYVAPDYQKFLDFFAVAPTYDINFCRDNAQYFPALSDGEINPPGRSAQDVVGSIDRKILRNTDREFVEKLMYYPYDNVDFQDEELAFDWCGSQTRNCSSCVITGNMSGLAWSRCADRVMTPRLAAKLHHLADLVEAEWPNVRVLVEEAWDEASSGNPDGSHPEESLFYEGRAARLRTPDPAHLQVLSHLAACAGFDVISRPRGQEYVEVFVKKQDGHFTAYEQFLSSQLLRVDSPTFHDLEYDYPEELKNETKIVGLFDGYGEHPEIPLSQNFRVKEFMAPQRRYLRIDPKLIECLQWTRDFVREPIEVLMAYRPRSYNRIYENRHENELLRPQAGQAAEIRITGYEDQQVVTNLAMSVMRACSAQFRIQHHILGLGFHSDRVYLDVKVTTIGNTDPWISLWNVDGQVELFQQLQDLRYELLTSGPPVVPQSWDTSCDIPDLGYNKHWYQVQVRPSCRERGTEFCRNSQPDRAVLIAKVKEQMQPILGFTDGPIFAQNKDADHCISTYCGSCNGAGSTWYKKLVACTNMLQFINPHVYRELKANKTTFFNTDNTDSTMHGLACKNGHTCLENTQIYAVFASIIMSTYRPDSDKAREVRLYDPSFNPSPLVDLIEQDMAYRAEGAVNVYVEYERDLSVLKKVVKILMVLNSNVTVVHFHVNETVFLDHVYERIHDWIEIWRYDTCPLWSRRTLAPFTVHVIPAEEVAFGMKDSSIRNRFQRELRSRDTNWLFRM